MGEAVSWVKIEIFIPEDHVEVLRDALAEVGAGRIGNYDHCVSVTDVRGYWRPLDGATPYLGEVGAICAGTECKVEVTCPRALAEAALKAIRAVHPYEEPLINVIPLLNAFGDTSLE
ncbi:MAG: YqfO family protein [Anaerolineae bacterium]|jgi:hypothetical protein|nr:YqfO family protein [Anaerolineae bacterium]